MFSRKKFHIFLILFITFHALKADDSYDCDKDEPLNCPDYCQPEDISTSSIVKHSILGYIIACVIITIFVGLLSSKTKEIEERDLLTMQKFKKYEEKWKLRILQVNKEKNTKKDEKLSASEDLAPPISEDSMSSGKKNTRFTYNKAFDEYTRKRFKKVNTDLNDPVMGKKFMHVLQEEQDAKILKKEKRNLKKFQKRGNIFIPNETDLMAGSSTYNPPNNVVLKDVFFNEKENEIFSIGTEIDDVQPDSDASSQSTVGTTVSAASRGKTRKGSAGSKK